MTTLTVPLSDGTDAEIKHLKVTESEKTLGIWTNPAGDCTDQLTKLREHLEKCTNRLAAGRLSSRWAWVSYYQQLCAKLHYGLGTNSSPVKDLDSVEEEGEIL